MNSGFDGSRAAKVDSHDLGGTSGATEDVIGYMVMADGPSQMAKALCVDAEGRYYYDDLDKAATFPTTKQALSAVAGWLKAICNDGEDIELAKVVERKMFSTTITVERMDK